MVVRDSVGDVLMSAGKRVNHAMEALRAEAEAMKFGLELAYDAGLRSVEVESVCLVLVSMLQNKRKE